jgi:5-methylcytosine-specific restriction endonuclease McrBC regulatory subunit McrC
VLVLSFVKGVDQAIIKGGKKEYHHNKEKKGGTPLDYIATIEANR